MTASDGTPVAPLDPQSRSDKAAAAFDADQTRVTGSSLRPAELVSDVTRISGDPAPVSDDADEIEHVRALIEGYELERRIHRGGQGVVYAAIQHSTKRRVALKILLEGPFAGESARRRFEREVELAASLRHPNIVTILDSGISHGRYYFAMELIHGQRLDHFVQQHRPPLHGVLRLFIRVCQAIHFAHVRGVIHRDLKPSNVLVDDDGAPHVLDFGLAKSQRVTDPQQTTVAAISTTGQILGTLAYMSPEQAAGAQDADIRSDVYSLGVIFYETLLGRTPYPVTGTLAEVLTRIANDEPTRPRSVRIGAPYGREIDDELETILCKCLEKDPARRYQSAGDLGRDLQHYVDGEPIEAKRASGLYMLRKTLRRYRWQAGTAGALLALLLAFFVALAFLYSREREARALAADAGAEARQRAEEATRAGEAERHAREQAERATRQAESAAEELRRTLVREKVQRGNLALSQGEWVEARNSFWDAWDDDLDYAASLWSLRNYHQTSGQIAASKLFYRARGPVGYSPSGRVAAISDTPTTISVLDAVTGKALGWFSAPRETRAVAVRDDGLLAAATSFGLRVWRVGDAAASRLVEWDFAQPIALALLTDEGRSIAAVAEERRLRCFDVATGAVLVDQALERGSFAALCTLSADQRRVVFASEQALYVVSLEESKAQVTRLDAPPDAGALRSAAFTAGGELLVLANELYQVNWCNIAQPLWTGAAPIEGRAGDRLIADASTGRIAVLRQAGPIELWSLAPHRRLRQLPLTDVLDARWTSDGDALTTLEAGGVQSVWLAQVDQPERRVHSRAARTWAPSADGSAIQLVDENDYSVLMPGEGGRAARARRLASALINLPLTSRGTPLVATSRNGGVSIIERDNLLNIQYPGVLAARVFPWQHPVTPRVTGIALTSDGHTLALTAQSAAGDEQQIHFLKIPTGLLRPRPQRRLEPAAASVTFAGSAIRTMGFLPSSNALMIARSNGALLVVTPAPDQGSALAAPAPLLTLDSAAERLAFDPSGRLMAAACEDGAIRVIALLDTSEVGRILAGQQVTALQFNHLGNVLMARTADGVVHLYDAETFDRILRLSAPRDASGLAAWIGESDRLLIGQPDGIYEYNFANSDKRIEGGRDFATSLEIARQLTEGTVEAAWSLAERLSQRNETAGAAARAAVLEAVLRRGGRHLADSWANAVRSPSDGPTLLRLGHAAIDGGRYELGYEALTAAKAKLGSVDAFTAWRLAECVYLLGTPSEAVRRLDELAARRDFDSLDLVKLNLQRLAALCLADRLAEADRALLQLNRLNRSAGRGNLVDWLAAVVIGSYMLGQQADSQVTASLKSVLSTFQDSWLMYRDDVEFFAGEMARKRGDHEAARLRYQRCIDIARDNWPSNWARHRLAVGSP